MHLLAFLWPSFCVSPMMVLTINFLLDFCATEYLIHWHFHWTILIFITNTILKKKIQEVVEDLKLSRKEIQHNTSYPWWMKVLIQLSLPRIFLVQGTPNGNSLLIWSFKNMGTRNKVINLIHHFLSK